MASVAEIFQTTALAAVMFAATNADDLVLLTVFFALPASRPSQVVLGQLAGIGSLTAIAYTLSSLALAVPHGWVPWLGVVPLLIGIRWLRRGSTDQSPPSVLAWWGIAGITIANGADNLGVYIPTFALQSGGEKILTGLVFFALTLVWCAIAWSATRHRTLGPRISKVCSQAAPFVLIAIGIWIIAHHPIFSLGLTASSTPP